MFMSGMGKKITSAQTVIKVSKRKVDCKFIFKHFMREKSRISVRYVKNVLVPRRYCLDTLIRFMRKKDPMVAIFVI
jgi:hypothetical protein